MIFSLSIALEESEAGSLTLPKAGCTHFDNLLLSIWIFILVLQNRPNGCYLEYKYENRTEKLYSRKAATGRLAKHYLSFIH
jgi:hypothetical protein